MERVIQERKILAPDVFDSNRIEQGAYELSLGREAYVTTDSIKAILDEETHGNMQVTIEPGEFAMLLTEEKVNMTDDSIGFISIRSKFKFRGLINVSGFHVDPGYEGHLKYSVYNAGGQEITLTRGDRMFPLWLSTLDDDTRDPYPDPDPATRERSSITSTDMGKLHGTPVSPSALEDRIRKIETRVNVATGFVVLAAIAFLALVIQIIQVLQNLG